MATKQEIYRMGIERGINVASWVDMPEINSHIDKSIDWQGLGEYVTYANRPDYMEILASEAESNDRQFSPFEFTANELNEMADSKPYDVWEVFESGISVGIRRNIAQRIRKAA